MSNKSKILVILGPTATGKSDLAVLLAKKYNGEIISADSRQVYKNLDIGTGKITKKEMLSIPHYMLDVVNAKKIYSVSDWQKQTQKIIAKILQKNKLPIICGGTGFYMESIVKNVSLPEVPPNKKLRESLNKKNTEFLFKMLLKIDPERAKTIDPKNKVRIIRAIEITKSLGKVPSLKDKNNPYEFLQIGFSMPDEILKERIQKRLTSRIKKGMLAEAKKLHKKGLSWKRMFELGLEYRYESLYLQNKISKEDFIKKLNTEIWRYAKRQKTWFKRDETIKWFAPKEVEKIEIEINKFLGN